MSKNWSNDARVNCNAFHNLKKLIDFELNLEQESNEFEDLFERAELEET